MEKTFVKPIKIYYDSVRKTMSVWFDDPQKEVIVEETGEEILISKDKHGRAIGVEVLNFSLPNRIKPREKLPVEALVV